VRLDDYELEMAPAPWMLVTRHQDRPGMMGRIGVMLGEADINIRAMHLGRSAPRSDAFMLLALDEAVPDDVADHIRAMDGVLDIWSVELGDGA
jgi:D-3-phosphoglycerate dehydrogenase